MPVFRAAKQGPALCVTKTAEKPPSTTGKHKNPPPPVTKKSSLSSFFSKTVTPTVSSGANKENSAPVVRFTSPTKDEAAASPLVSDGPSTTTPLVPTSILKKSPRTNPADSALTEVGPVRNVLSPRFSIAELSAQSTEYRVATAALKDTECNECTTRSVLEARYFALVHERCTEAKADIIEVGEAGHRADIEQLRASELAALSNSHIQIATAATALISLRFDESISRRVVEEWMSTELLEVHAAARQGVRSLVQKAPRNAVIAEEQIFRGVIAEWERDAWANMERRAEVEEEMTPLRRSESVFSLQRHDSVATSRPPPSSPLPRHPGATKRVTPITCPESPQASPHIVRTARPAATCRAPQRQDEVYTAAANVFLACM